MERLILLRHGKAEAGSPSGADFERRLTERGQRDSALMGRVLAEAGFTPDLALVSAAVRARQTWEAAAPAFPDAQPLFLPSLYSAAADEVLTLAEAEGTRLGARTVMVVGHNPILHQLALRLAAGATAAAADRTRLNAGFPTAAACAVDLAAKRLMLFTPKTSSQAE